MKNLKTFRIDQDVLDVVEKSGVKDVAAKVEEFLRILAHTALDGQREGLKDVEKKYGKK